MQLPFSHLPTVVALSALLLAHAGSAHAGRVELGAAASQAELTLGCLYPMTERAAIYGQDSIAGIQVALSELQAQREAGQQVPRMRVIIDDDQSKASYGTSLARAFIRKDGVQVLCGMVSSGVAIAVSQLAREEKVLMIGTDHASSRMTLENGHRYYFRVTNDTWTSMAAGAHYLKALQAKTGWKRLAFIGPDYEYGHVSRDDLHEALRQLGVQFDDVTELWPRLYEPDYSAYIAALEQAKPDIIVSALWGGDFHAFVKQAAGTRLFETSRLANFDTGGNYDFLVALGDKAPPGLILSARHHNNWPQTPRNQSFVERFHTLTGRYPTYAAEGAYTGVMVLAKASQKAGGATDTESLVNALEGLEIALPEDPPGFVSRIDAQTHQILQTQAVGTPVRNDDYPPAKVMLGDWAVYSAQDLLPDPAVRARRQATQIRNPEGHAP
ncbi:ABC transporter substrate-binding protein [Pseudomonas alkylphenolica]|uniref:Amino acid ABC transporter substrate-binding protein n=1 Tax=Pseudomonas alkylphenolica TaxID=237609 RepID=A0A443ZSZ7_9PSED|nr:ABC transporter substrate-binding protein [Pseudomonas alkylphenolica]MBH3426397.1 ABC transporter substrate-binding protein [Pseudomonas alkylphenolica]RWU22833.1 amino acid ABC transporter substrate-binding protein [Pseudomonas alkylphenolica]